MGCYCYHHHRYDECRRDDYRDHFSQYTQGSLATITCTTTNQLGIPTAPDNNQPPRIFIDFISSPNEPECVHVLENRIMTPITTSWFYFHLDTAALSLGSYEVTIVTTIAGQEMKIPQRFDVIAGNGFTLLPVDPISRLRLRLKDNDPNPIKWVWSDMELSEYLQGSLDEFNAAPPRSYFHWHSIPLVFTTNIIKGAQIAALEAEAARVAQQPITFHDKGITVNLPQQSSTLQNIARELREQQEKERLRIKRQMYPKIGYIVTPDTPYMSYPPIRAIQNRWY